MFDRFRLTHRIWASVIVFALILGAVMVNAFMGMKAARNALAEVHEKRMEPAVALGQMRRGYLVNRMEMLLMFQHAPDSPLLSVHGHPVEMHLENIAKLISNANTPKVGYLDPAAYERTVKVLMTGGSSPVIKKDPGKAAYSHAVWEAASK